MRRFLASNSWQDRTPAWVLTLAVMLFCYQGKVQAGGSGLNVVIVANTNSPDSLELANYYREQRNVPPGNLLRIGWTGGNIEWTHQQFTNTLLNPLLTFLEQEQLSGQIRYVALSMDLPYRITGGQDNSTTAALFYGFKGSASGTANSYALSEVRFAEQTPDTAPTNSFLSVMLTADTVEAAKRMVDQGIAGDRTFPTQHTWLVKSDDIDRNKRFKDFDNAIFNARLCEDYCLFRTNLTGAPPWTNLLGCQLGLENFNVNSNTFTPGAIADSMTSFGGQIFESSGQTTLLEFIEAGASGSYGTVTEPLPVTSKFPNPMVYFYQSRGFSLAEAYYQSVEQPYQGLFVGELLSAPWQQKFSGGWQEIATKALLVGITNLCVTFSEGSSGRSIDRVDLFVNGRYLQTLTNIPPEPGNQVTVTLNGHEVSYDAPTNATLGTVAAGLAAELNQPVNENITRVTAQAIGDRIELQSTAEPLPEGMFEFIDDNGTSNTTYLAAPGDYSRASTVGLPGSTSESEFRVQFATDPGVSNVLQASSNLVDWVEVASNAMGGVMEFIDTDAVLYPRRYYRVSVPAPKPTPFLEVAGITVSNELQLHVVGPTNHPYVIQASSDFVAWTDLLTNSLGGDSALLDPYIPSNPARYYRTRSADTNDYESTAVTGETGLGGNIVRVTDTSPGEILVWASTNATDWRPIYSYAGSPQIQTHARSSSGGGEPVTTFLTAAQPEFAASTAQGIRRFGVELDFFGPPSLSDTSFLSLELIKTNDAVVTLTVTNSPGNTDMKTFVTALVDAINETPELTAEDGVEADDILDGFLGQILFNLRARAPGLTAAGVQARLTGSSDLFITPGSSVQLKENIGDLNSRNHLYVSKGTRSLTHYFDLDTTQLPDGHHELTAVAYEGTHVYSQTRETVSIIVSNTPLQATLALTGHSSALNVTNELDLVVTASTATNIQEILLYTTGGFYAGRTNQEAASFHVPGQDLGVGHHAFHALINTTNGSSYCTDRVNITLTK